MRQKMPEGCKLLATIRKESKYHDSQQLLNEEGKPVPFEVELVFGDDYCVIGNNNQYTLFDVQLYVAWDGDATRKLAMHNKPW